MDGLIADIAVVIAFLVVVVFLVKFWGLCNDVKQIRGLLHKRMNDEQQRRQ